MDLLRTSLHAESKKVVKDLNRLTLKEGTRFLAQQPKVNISNNFVGNPGAHHIRLNAWYYVRRVEPAEVISAMQEVARSYVDTDLPAKIRAAMEGLKVYHVVIRGNDPLFMPPGENLGKDIVTEYLCEKNRSVRDEVEKYLLEDLDNPSAIQQAMQTPNFDDILRDYFYKGDTAREETLHLVGRLEYGNYNLLHKCIMEGHVETLRLLLEHYTVENQQETPWRVLAEPLRRVGEFENSAFHQAAYDGQRDSLKELVDWANRHGHDITSLRNAEKRNELQVPIVRLTCLELAEQSGNLGCYNVLAPSFGVPLKEDAMDRRTRSDRDAVRRQPRVELTLLGEEVPESTVPLASLAWSAVLAAVGRLAGTEECQARERSQVIFRICSTTFADDISADQAEQLFVAAAGASLHMERCKVKSDRTLMALLETLVRRLEGNAVGDLLPPACPMQVDVSSPVLDQPGTVGEERELDLEAAALAKRFVASVGRWPGFMGARHGVLSLKQRIRLQKCDDGGKAWAASYAAEYATHIAVFLNKKPVAGQLEEWMRDLSLVPLARVMYDVYSHEEHLPREPDDPRSAINPAVIHILRFTLSAWFALFPTDIANPWSVWAQRLGTDVAQLAQLAKALDIVLKSLLQMWHALDFVCKVAPDARAVSIADLVTQCVPEPVRAGGHLPQTAALLAAHEAQAALGRLSLTAMPASLRPARCPRVPRS